MNLRVLRELAADEIEDQWTTAEEDWKKQAVQNLKFKGSLNSDNFDNGGWEGQTYLFTTHYCNNNPKYTHKRCHVQLKITIDIKSEES